MLRIIFFVFALCYLLPAFSTDRDALTGYDGFDFGISEEEVRERVDVAEETTDSILDLPSAKILTEEGKVTIQGMQFLRRFIIHDRALAAIQIEQIERENLPGCGSRFDQLLGMFKARYGEPDSEADRSGDGQILQIQFVRFTFGNFGVIILGTAWTNEQMNESGEAECKVLVSYKAPRPGQGF